MAAGLSSPLGISGVVFIAVGIILTLVGLILLIINENASKAWYMWFLAITGIILGIIGSIMLAVALLDVPKSMRMVSMPPLNVTKVTVGKTKIERPETPRVSFSPDTYDEDACPITNKGS